MVDLRVVNPKEDDTEMEPASGIPPKTWSLLQKAGHGAAERLEELINGAGFKRLKPTDQARLIEMALNRAYGPPIKRAATLELKGNLSDEVANSLARLSSTDLPEYKSPNRG